MSNKVEATFHPVVGLQGAPVLDRPAPPYELCWCRRYNPDRSCGRPAERQILAAPCPTCHPDATAYPPAVCWSCYAFAGARGVFCRAGHCTPRELVWTEVAS